MTFKRSALAIALSSLWTLASIAQTTAPTAVAPPAPTTSTPSSAGPTVAATTTERVSAALASVPLVQPKPSSNELAPTVVSMAPVSAPSVPTAQVGSATPVSATPSTPLPSVTAKPEAEKSIEVLPANAVVVPIANEPASSAASEVIVVAEPILEAPPTDLWDRIRSGFAMSDLDDEYVRKWELWYSSRPDYIQRVTERGSKYWFYIVTEIERRGMPLEIALLPVIESAFVTHANSSAAAAGIWQFIPSTGKNFGMKQDWWADSRRDIVAATKGALDYLEKLHGMFGDWHLALASYNWGEGAVSRAVATNQNAGKGTDYASLNMPVETRNYLPKLQAVKNIVMNPAAYNITQAANPNQPYYKTISLAKHIDVDKAVKMAEISKDEFIALNPAHNRPVIGGRDEHQILLPADKADLFISRLESGDRALVSWMAYKTREGDRLDALASRFNTSVDTLRAVNGIRAAPPTLPAGYNLLVPSSGPSEEALGSLQNAVFTKLPEYVPGPALPTIYRVAKGDTLATIAKRYRVSVQKLAQWNRVSAKARVSKGTLLAVSGPMPMTTKLVRVKKGGRFVMMKQTVPAVRSVLAKGNGGKTKFVLAKSPGKKRFASRGKRRG